MIETNIDGKTLDIVDKNIENLKIIFPEAFTDGKIDFDMLKQSLGEYVDDESEKYKFTWNGKGKAIKLANTPSTGTLRPFEDESKNFKSTENLYIEGDNLEVLKLLQKSYHNKVKMIYIDPPYNTGKDFVYKDNFKDNIANYLEITGQTDENGKKLSTNTESNGRYHTDWLNMIYPRLKLARNLLTDDGVIFISIDDNEVANLRKICDEIFGEDNFVAEFVWQKNFAPKNDNKYISISHEYILHYAKEKSLYKRNLLVREEKHNSTYKNPDNDKRGLWSSGSMLVTTFNQNGVFQIVSPNNTVHLPPVGRCWRYTQLKVDELIKDNRLWFGKNRDNVPRVKRFLVEMPNGIVPQTLLKYEDVGSGQNGTSDCQNIFGGIQMFDFPKPINLISRFIHIASNNNDIILDFFSGSSTTAHAVMQLNAEDGGNRKFIMVQLPEICDEKSETFKKGYKNICEIGKARIRLAGEKIKTETLEFNKKAKDGTEKRKVPDIGFKVLKLAKSNFKKWSLNLDDLNQSLQDNIENDLDNRTYMDFIYEIMLTYGIELTAKIDKLDLKKVCLYHIKKSASQDFDIIICLSNNITNNITKDIARDIIEYKKKHKIENLRAVFKDNEFQSDEDKINIIEILKCAGVEEFISI